MACKTCKHFLEMSEPLPYKVGFCEIMDLPIDESDSDGCDSDTTEMGDEQ